MKNKTLEIMKEPKGAGDEFYKNWQARLKEILNLGINKKECKKCKAFISEDDRDGDLIYCHHCGESIKNK